MADFPGNIPSQIEPLFRHHHQAHWSPHGNPQACKHPQSCLGKHARNICIKVHCSVLSRFPSFPLPNILAGGIGQGPSLVTCRGGTTKQHGPVAGGGPIITEDQAVTLGVQDDNDRREAIVRDGTTADTPLANDINLAAHEASRVALERQCPPSLFLRVRTQDQSEPATL
ncbi:hypothetical protein KEM48_000335 [Puccinia striiformis f. sp. tritici PST-130]|nr:hypothetical protein KEM48_000335 [Puccinia striiformis f. sp. tritici PST-130]